MAEEFPAAIYGGSWWLSPRTPCNFSSCSSDIADMENLIPFCLKDCVDMKSKSSDESSDGSMAIQDIQTPGGCNATMSPDSAFETMATVFSDLVDWNQNLSSRVQEEMNTFSTSGDDDLKAEHQVFAAGSDAFTTFPINSYGYTSSLVQSLLDSNYSPPPSPPLYGFQSNSNNLNIAHLTNNTPFLSASSSLLTHTISSTQFLSSSYKEHNHQESWDLGSSAKKGPDEFPFKRPRFETPSPLPTFKVRKEKLGDRITALQQLVSPFGKTDTASVLHEAIEYIKLLHDQVNILSAPYMKGATNQLQPIRGLDKAKDEEHKQDLRSVGLCLVPVSSTFPVATEMSTGFWTPS